MEEYCLECGNKIMGKYATKFCNADCASKYNGKIKRKKSIEEYYKSPNTCKGCGEIIKVRDGKKVYETRLKKFCSSSCSATYYNAKRERKKRYCDFCGNEIKTKGSKSFCSQNCYKKSVQKALVDKWKNGEESGTRGVYLVANFIRRYLLLKYDNKCEKCGWGKIHSITKKVPLHIHHKDGDCANNKENNLELLCPNCHSLTKTYGSLNKNSKRFFRPKSKVVLVQS